jgi:WD40 repeat protein
MATANLDKLKVTKTHSHQGVIFSAVRKPGTNALYLGDSEFKVSEVDPTAEKWTPRVIGKHTSYVTSVVVADKSLLSTSYDGQLIWWDVEKASAIRSVEVSKKWVRQLAASPKGELVASVADDMVCKLWDVASGKLVRELRGHQEKTPTNFNSMLYACTFSPDGKLLATADKVGHIVLWDVASGKQTATLESPGMYTWDPKQRVHSIGGIRAVTFSPDGKSLAVGGIGKIGNIDHLEGPARVEVFDVQSGKSTQLFEKTKFKGLVERLVYHPQGAWLLAVGGANDGLCFFVDTRGAKVLKEEKLAFHAHSVLLNEAADTLTVVGHNKAAVLEMKG